MTGRPGRRPPQPVEALATGLTGLGWVTDLLVAGSLATGDHVPGVSDLDLVALTDGAVSCGLPRQVALELVAQMTRGAAEMVLATGRHPAALKDDVTTPGGCTIAGLMVLEDGKARSVLARAIETTKRVAANLGNPA